MSLRARLFVALLSLALLPTLLLTLFTLDELGRATDRWYEPGVIRALESAVEVSRLTLTRVEATVLERSDDWAASLGPPLLDAAQRSAMRGGLREAGLDFAQIYRRDGDRWRLAEQVVPAGVIVADSLDFSTELDAALEGTRLLRSRQGVLAATARASDGRMFVTGIRLTPDFFARIESIGRAREMYGRLAVLVDVQHRYTGLLVAAIVALVVAAAFVLARALSRQMTAPLGALSAAFERVATGDLATRVPESGARELRALSASFNVMTERLAGTRDALARAEREAAWRDVARRLAHEIKNPLTPMRLSLHRLERRVDVVPEAQRGIVRDSLQALLAEVEHLTRLAEQFAQFARLPEPRIEQVDLAELTRGAVALHEPEGLSIRVDAPEPVRVSGDRLLLSRAVHNLLLNACEASPPGGGVEVRCGHDGREGWIEVLDRGPGIPPEVASRAFEPYVSTKNRGSGLGLSLVRDIAAQHGGRATLENREGGGARARLVLPLT